jgi:hypothetical protein
MANSKISALPAASTPLAGAELVPVVQGGITEQVSVTNLTAGRAVSALSLSTTAGIVDVRATSGIGVRFIETSSGNTNRIQLGTGAGFGYVDATAGVGTTYLSLQAASVEYAKLQTTGNFTLNTGNLVIGTSGKGIDFSATAGTGTSELLADYEEGTWTPVIQGSGTAGTYEINSGASYSVYTKIGRLVTVNSQIVLAGTITGGGTSNFQITGLPFAKAGDSQATGSIYLSGVDFDATAAYILPLFTTGGSGSTTLNVQQVFDNAAGSPVQISGVSAGDVILMTISYIA